MKLYNTVCIGFRITRKQLVRFMHGCKELETTVKSRSYNCDVVLDLTTELGLDRKA